MTKQLKSISWKSCLRSIVLFLPGFLAVFLHALKTHCEEREMNRRKTIYIGFWIYRVAGWNTRIKLTAPKSDAEKKNNKYNCKTKKLSFRSKSKCISFIRGARDRLFLLLRTCEKKSFYIYRCTTMSHLKYHWYRVFDQSVRLQASRLDDVSDLKQFFFVKTPKSIIDNWYWFLRWTILASTYICVTTTVTTYDI